MSQANEQPGGSRPSKETNSVNTAAAENQGDSVDADTRLLERVTEFVESYPELAEMPLSDTHGRKLRRVVTESRYETVMLEAHDDRPQDDSELHEELRQRAATTWADGLVAFLNAHLDYQGLVARFANDAGEEFDVPLSDAWGMDYNNKQYARAKALQREMAGGERPSGASPPGQWDDPTTAMLTLTATSTPGSDRLPPVDHLDAVHDSFSYDGTRDALRNTMEYHLGLDPNEWGYWLQTEPHGVSGDGGLNACYTHIHVAVYFDGAGLDGEIVGSELERVIDKHLDVCEFADFSAHNYEKIDRYTDSDGCISVNEDVSNLGSYLAAYLGAGHEEELLERPVEYLAWGALYWATGRRRTSRSQLVNDAIAADRCDQRYESSEANQSVPHGEKVAENTAHGSDVVCARCNSGWRVDQDRLDELPSDDDLRDLDDTEVDLPDPDSLSIRWPSAEEGASSGETLSHRDARKCIQRYLKECSEPPSFPQLKGALQLASRWDELAKSMLDGADGIPEPESFNRLVLDSEWELVAIVDRDGDVHSPGGGGIDMVPLHLPRSRLLRELQEFVQKSSTSHIRCQCGFGGYPDSLCSHLLNHHGVEHPEIAMELIDVEPISS